MNNRFNVKRFGESFPTNAVLTTYAASEPSVDPLHSSMPVTVPKVEGFELHLGIFDTIEQARDAPRQHSMESPGPTTVCE
jgi:hypothetical protein